MCLECYEKHAFYESIIFQSLKTHQILQRQWHVVEGMGEELLAQHHELQAPSSSVSLPSRCQQTLQHIAERQERRLEEVKQQTVTS